MSRRRFRDRIPFRPLNERFFRWRGGEVSRLENLADAVFGFSVTLLVVAVEVPRDFPALLKVIRGFPAFVACFAMLMFFWNAHYRFFRRYGLEDLFTRMVNYGILLMVLFAVYPLKFLFSAWFAAMFGGDGTAPMRSLDELRFVFRTYGAGLALTWCGYLLLYWHAYRSRHRLELTPAEILHTRADLSGFAICVGVSLVSILLTWLPVSPFLPGFIYCLIGPGMWLNYARLGRKLDALA